MPSQPPVQGMVRTEGLSSPFLACVLLSKYACEVGIA